MEGRVLELLSRRNFKIHIIYRIIISSYLHVTLLPLPFRSLSNRTASPTRLDAVRSLDLGFIERLETVKCLKIQNTLGHVLLIPGAVHQFDMTERSPSLWTPTGCLQLWSSHELNVICWRWQMFTLLHTLLSGRGVCVKERLKHFPPFYSQFKRLSHLWMEGAQLLTN